MGEFFFVGSRKRGLPWPQNIAVAPALSTKNIAVTCGAMGESLCGTQQKKTPHVYIYIWVNIFLLGPTARLFMFTPLRRVKHLEMQRIRSGVTRSRLSSSKPAFGGLLGGY